MSSRHISLAVAALFVAASIVTAQQSAPPSPSPSAVVNVTGTWNGSLRPDDPSTGGEENGFLVLKQDGAVVTGTAGPDANRQSAISKGKIATTKDGTVLTFELVRDTMVMQFEMKLADGHLKGGAKAERDGQKMTATVDFTRAK